MSSRGGLTGLHADSRMVLRKTPTLRLHYDASLQVERQRETGVLESATSSSSREVGSG